MASNAYHFVDRWRVEGTVEEVGRILSDGPDLARWWPSTYLEVKTLEAGDPQTGLGQVGAVYAKGWLPYTIRFTFRVVESFYPRGFAIEAEGDLTGRGVWTFEQDGPGVNLTYDWTIRADKPLLRTFSFLLKPLFRSNHNWTMRQGEQSLKLELQRRRARTPEEASAVPAPPGPAPVWPYWLGLAGAVLGGLGALAARWPTLRTEHSVIIRRPVADVFAFVADLSNEQRWQPEIKEVTVTSPGPLQAGSTFREVRHTLGQEFVWDMRVTDYAAPSRICIASEGAATPYRGCRLFDPVPSGTRVTEQSEVRLPLALRPLTPLLARLARRPIADAYARLKALLEEQASLSP